RARYVSAGVPRIRRPSNARTNPIMQIRIIRCEALRLLTHDLRSSPALPSRDIENGLVDWLLLCEWIGTRSDELIIIIRVYIREFPRRPHYRRCRVLTVP